MDALNAATAPRPIPEFPDNPGPATVTTLRYRDTEHRRAKKAAWLMRLSLNEFLRQAVRIATDRVIDDRGHELPADEQEW